MSDKIQEQIETVYLLSLYSFSKDWNISFTDDILVALKALLPAKAKPFSKFPLSAFISAMIIQ
jgi:hypothetical protein